MKLSIQDEGVQALLEEQLKQGEYSWLVLTPCCDFTYQQFQLPCYEGMLLHNGAVFQAWLVTICLSDGSYLSSVYNQENYPTLSEAVAQHMGKLALEGRFKVVEVVDASKTG